MQPVPRSLSAQAGFTLIEVLVASVILMVGVFSAMALVDRANEVTVTTRSREAATNLAREMTEAARGLPYADVVTSTMPGLLAQQPGLTPVPGTAGYVVERRGFTYTVAVETCIMDEARDEGGDHSGGGFCADSAPAGTLDKNPDDYRRVTATVSWRREGVDRSVRQTTVINNPGSAGGPAVRTLKLAAFTNPPPQLTLLNVPSQEVDVEFTTSSRPQTTNWLVDGTAQRPAPTSVTADGKTWRATWDFSGLHDGTYVVAAEAFDRYGVSGPGRSLTVRINRGAPLAPTGLVGGRNEVAGERFVELEWQRNLERDIEDYVVQRATSATGGTWQAVCTTVDTVCVDATAAAGVTYYYRVLARDKGTFGETRDGAPSSPLLVTTTNTPPNPVGDLAVAPGVPGFGSTTLTWRRPSPDDPDTGDAVLFYRIYRDGQAVAQRLDRWYDDRATVTYVDDTAGGAQHSYVVRAVDSHYRESDPVEVTG